MKQRQANVLEARSTKQIAQQAEKQGEAVMLFTIVTIIFLPLTSVASIFGMNASEFGQGTVKLGFIFKIMVPTSAGVAILILWLAFHRRVRRVLTLLIAYLWLICTQWLCWIWLSRAEDWLDAKVDDLRKEEKKKERDKVEERKKKKITKEEARVERKKVRDGKGSAKKAKNGTNGTVTTNGPLPTSRPASGDTGQANARSTRRDEGTSPRRTSLRPSRRSTRRSGEAAGNDLEAQRRVAPAD